MKIQFLQLSDSAKVEANRERKYSRLRREPRSHQSTLILLIRFCTNGSDTYQQVMDKLTQIYLPKVDTNRRIGAFRQIKQLDGENFDHFISRLKNASVGCGFTNVKNEMVIQITHHAKSRQLKESRERLR